MGDGKDEWMEVLLMTLAPGLEAVSSPVVRGRSLAPTLSDPTSLGSVAPTVLDSDDDAVAGSRSPRRCSGAAWLEPDAGEEVESFYKLNVIEPSPEEDRPRRPAARPAAQMETDDQPHSERRPNFCSPAPSCPVVQWSGLAQGTSFPSSAAGAAASRACSELFGSSSSVFRHGAAASFLLRGSVAGFDTQQAMARSLPESLQVSAMATFREMALLGGAVLMGAPVNPVRHAEQQIQHRLNLHKSRALYIGITERPVARFQEHRLAGYGELWLYAFESSRESGAAERSLIRTFRHFPECANVGDGNERASRARPHYLYIVWKNQVLQVRR